MDDVIAGVFAGVLVFACGFGAGWQTAHSEVATECERQGGFYVGKRDFVCAPKAKDN